MFTHPFGLHVARTIAIIGGYTGEGAVGIEYVEGRYVTQYNTSREHVLTEGSATNISMPIVKHVTMVISKLLAS